MKKEELKGKWMLNESGNERWDALDRFNSKEEAIECGIETLEKYNDLSDISKANIDLSDMFNIYPDGFENVTSFDVGKIAHVRISIDPDRIIEEVAERVYDECGDFADGYLDDVTKEHKQELEDLVFGWFKKHDYFPSCYLIENAETIDLNDFAEDVSQ